MLDTETKRRIDSCRDILVGKIPDPKSQVEQITIALIYKFMDDMDNESIDMGGKSSFFKGEFQRYSWTNIFDPHIGGHELLNLYGEALVKMNHNPNIPQLFRDIFKNAFLPYRDPETLKSFLKEIHNFRYDHSEKLGDAFEYLLSVLSSQGDAGQFRTPRHIIDFMVEVVEPRLNETILDPACGTAGFLVSSYKHIKRTNPKLSHSQKDKLINNIVGFDISPDMVRLSLVNMYLHGFVEPHIHEYDTLTSETRWGEMFDVIMANPPFMTPKGGIRPHNKFSIQAKRSEVLFVDYIAEHLNVNGRAAVIVPEGIIFQSQNAYKSLRKMLVEKYLWAVVSLPAGIFNPYSGVKTSILFMDKSLAKRIDRILFVKIDNDGFGLGAQRRAIDKNDLTAALKFLNIYKSKIENYKSEIDNPLAHAVPKSEIAKSGDYNLTGDRYRTVKQPTTSEWPMVGLGNICNQERKQIAPYSPQAKLLPYIGLEHIESNTGEILKQSIDQSDNDVKSLTFAFDERHILYGKLRPYLNKVALPNFAGRCSTEIIPLIPKKINRKLLACILRREETTKFVMQSKTGTRMPRADIDLLLSLKIPLPPLEVQEKIVTEIEGYQKIIDAARQIVQSYKPTIKINPTWPMVKIGRLVTINNGRVLTDFEEKGKVACIKVSDMNLSENSIEITTTSHWTNDSFALLPVNSVIFPKRGAAIATNKKRITKIPCLIDNNCMGLTVMNTDNLNPYYLFIFLLTFDLSKISNSAGVALINNPDISGVEIPLPSIEEQKQIVSQIEAEQNIVNQNKKLIEMFEAKIKDTISEVWGKAK